jgi:hypothetical protein
VNRQIQDPAAVTGSGNLSVPAKAGLTGDDMEGQSIEKACNGNRCDVADDIAGACVGCHE